jgi:hypothetical protein
MSPPLDAPAEDRDAGCCDLRDRGRAADAHVGAHLPAPHPPRPTPGGRSACEATTAGASGPDRPPPHARQTHPPHPTPHSPTARPPRTRTCPARICPPAASALRTCEPACRSQVLSSPQVLHIHVPVPARTRGRAGTTRSRPHTTWWSAPPTGRRPGSDQHSTPVTGRCVARGEGGRAPRPFRCTPWSGRQARRNRTDGTIVESAGIPTCRP